mgnify:FL=1
MSLQPSKTDPKLGYEIEAHLRSMGVHTPTISTDLDETAKISKIQSLFTDIMETLGMDLSDDSLTETPKRVAKMFVSELKTAIEMCLLNGANAKSFDEDYTDYELLSHLFPVLQYFTTQNEFVNFIELTERNFPDFSYTDLVLKSW